MTTNGNQKESVDRLRQPMKKEINLLIQIQDLMEARAQQEALVGPARLDGLDQSIQSLLSNMDADVAGHFERLHRKWHTAIVPVINGGCAGCGMALPISLVHEVKASARIYQCPNCSRMLFTQDGAVSRAQRPPTGLPRVQQVGIARFSSPELMLPSLAAKSGDAAIHEICAHMEAAHFVDRSAQLAEDALRRETLSTTAMEHGIAFPHVRGIEGGGVTLALGISRKGLHFTPGSKLLTRIIFFVAIPTAASVFYLKLLAGLSQTFSTAENRDKLLTADSPEALWKALLQTTKRLIK